MELKQAWVMKLTKLMYTLKLVARFLGMPHIIKSNHVLASSSSFFLANSTRKYWGDHMLYWVSPNINASLDFFHWHCQCQTLLVFCQRHQQIFHIPWISQSAHAGEICEANICSNELTATSLKQIIYQMVGQYSKNIEQTTIKAPQT